MKCVVEFSKAALSLLQLDQALDSERTVVLKSKDAYFSSPAVVRWLGHC